jgi:hypothetical protein
LPILESIIAKLPPSNLPGLSNIPVSRRHRRLEVRLCGFAITIAHPAKTASLTLSGPKATGSVVLVSAEELLHVKDTRSLVCL